MTHLPSQRLSLQMSVNSKKERRVYQYMKEGKAVATENYEKGGIRFH